MPPKASSIEDLLKQAKPAGGASATPAPAKPGAAAAPKTPPSVAAKLEERMGEIKQGEKEKLVQEKAAQLSLPYITLRGFPIAPEALSLITKDIAATMRVLPFFLVGDEVRLATPAPSPEIDKLAERIQHPNLSRIGRQF
jgi:hypothetical protein